MYKGMIFQYVIIGVVFIVLVVYVVRRILSKNNRGGCSSCDSRTCCAKRVDESKEKPDCCKNR